MSKLKVNQFESINASINEGRKINFERCSPQQVKVDKCHCAREQGQFSKNFFAYKTLHSYKNRKYPNCNHANDFKSNRDLASPKQKVTQPKLKLVRRNIQPASVRIYKLAQPRRHELFETFKVHHHHFPIFQVEAMVKKMCEYEFSTNQQILNEIKQKLHRVKKQKMEIKKMRNKIKKCNKFDSLAESLEKSFRHIMIGNQSFKESEENKMFAKFVHNSLLNVLKCPHAASANNTLLEFSDKFAWCMSDLFKRNAEELGNETLCIDRFKKLCVPIDGYYTFELTQENIDSLKSEDVQKAASSRDENKYYRKSEIVPDDFIEGTNSELSLLRISQIHITPEECQLVAEKLRHTEAVLKTGMLKRSASKKSLKGAPQSLQNAGLESLNIKKKKKTPKKKKKKGKKINLKCLGELNPKPQWAVEWNAVESK